MKCIFIVLLFILSLGASAQDPCNKSNVEKLLNGYPTDFYSRVQANDCLIKAKANGVAGIGIVAGKDKNSFGFVTTLGTRYLKQNKKDFFIGKTLLGKYKVEDGQEDGNKVMAKAKFVPRTCEISAKECEAKSPSHNFNKEFCRCEPKEARYCGDKKWSLQRKDEAQASCDKRESSIWDDATCECSEEKFCGDKKWSLKKKEKETESCLDSKGHEWDDNSCSCVEKLFCSEKKWSLNKLEKEETKCAKKENHVWDPDNCECEVDTNKTVMCQGKPVDAAKMKAQEKSCEEKSDAKTHYSWNEEECSCEKEKVTALCDGETIAKSKHDRKQDKCLARIEKDDRYSWNDERCECVKEEKAEEEENQKLVNLCGGKKMSQKKMDRKIRRCDEIQGKWDPENCKCQDPCYTAEESEVVENEVCTEDEQKLGDVKISDITKKLCEKALPETELDKIRKKCEGEVLEFYKSSPENGGIQPIKIKIKYTSDEKVLCGNNVGLVHNQTKLHHALPANVPTTDPAAFQGDCQSGASLKPGNLNKYRPYGNLDCKQMENINKANAEILKMANDSLNQLFEGLKIQDKISPEEMDIILSKSSFKLNVVGTANRSNNGTGITLDDLAKERKEQAEKTIRTEILKQIQFKVKGGSYVPKNPDLFNYNGISRAIGPLNPAATVKSMQAVLNEAGAPAELKKCKGTNAKAMYDCSVDYFVDKECPSLSDALKEEFCKEASEDLRKQLKGQTTSNFLETYKMFQLELGMSSDMETKSFESVGTIEVECAADITKASTEHNVPSITKMLKVTKPGFFRRMKKDCREERKELNEKYGKRNVRKAANQRKNPEGIVLEE